MTKIYNIAIILSFAGLWITSMVSSELEIVLGFILIFTFGILHGSNDILLIDSISSSKTKYPFFRVLGTYLLTVILAVIVFYLIPIVALLLFIVFSAFHFGEQHWNYRLLTVSKPLKHVFYFIYGLLILQILFALNTADVIEIVSAITHYTITEDIITYGLICTILVFTGVSLKLYFTSEVFKSLIWSELFYLIIFTIIFKVSTLIWGFTIYFIFWHSIPSLFEQVSFIYGNFTKEAILQYCKKAFPYWITSLIGMAIVYFIFKNNTIFYALFFSFIAAVTFPHALVINKMFDNKNAQSNK